MKKVARLLARILLIALPATLSIMSWTSAVFVFLYGDQQLSPTDPGFSIVARYYLNISAAVFFAFIALLANLILWKRSGWFFRGLGVLPAVILLTDLLIYKLMGEIWYDCLL